MSTLTASTAYADTSENAGGGTLQVDTAASTEASGADAADSSAATGSGASADSVSNADVTADADAPATTSDAATADAPAPADAITATNQPTAQPAAQTATDAAVEDAAQDLAQLAGRDFQGQVTKTINGKTYILIGNEQQLRAIGSGKKVTRPVWEITQEYRKTGLIKGGWVDVEGSKTEIYAGDADLSATSKLDEGSSEKSDELGVSLAGHTRKRYVTLDDYGNEVKADGNATSSTLTYAADANYIIFRNIDVGSDAASGTSSNATWTPLMFSGTMLGAATTTDAAKTAGALWSTINADGISTNDTAQRPVISNVNVTQTGKLDVSSHTGIGFFGTVSHKLSETNPFTGSATPAYVNNIKLRDVSVTNESTKVKVDQTLISSLLGVLGTVVGGLVSTLLKILTLGKVDLSGLIESLLNVRAADPSSLATGAFAGRIVGEVTVDKCEVEGASVSSAADMTGGFAGYVKGEVKYDILSDALGDIVKLLTNILNLIPGLGLGDLITLLLNNNIIKASQLLPVAYYNPTISKSGVVNFASGTVLGSAGKNYAGGFAGVQAGTIVTDAYIQSDVAYTVRAKAYAGGFAGVIRDDVMEGALSDLGVDLPSLARLAIPQSIVATSSLTADVTVEGGSYAGGFAGAMAGSHAVNDSLTGAVNVTASGIQDGTADMLAYAGGFTGAATLGWAMDLGAGDYKNTNPLNGVGGLLKGLLGSNNQSEANTLLSLAGLSESEILGAQVSGSLTVSSANDYAGGMVGRGTGPVIASSDTAHVGGLAFYKQGKLDATAVASRTTSLTGLDSVTAKGSYAGGIAGMLVPGAVAALLNDTLGLGAIGQKLGDGQFKMFEVSNVTVAGATDGATVSVDGCYAGGAIGCATGGDVDATTLTGVKRVEAKGEAGGFIGFSGPSDAADVGGLDVLGLIKVSGLLSVAKYSAVEVTDSSVAGVTAGMTVAATGVNAAGETNVYAAGGFFGRANSTKSANVHATAVKAVTADASTSDGAAGGFVGVSATGGLADAVNGEGEDSGVLKNLLESGLISVDGLVGAVPYLLPNYQNATVTFVNGGSVEADIAGGFAGDFQGGKVNIYTDDDLKDATGAYARAKTAAEQSPWGVINIDHVTGGAYAGGWGGRVTSGALASAGKGGISLLGKLGTVDIAQLLDVVEGYVPLINRSGVLSNADTVAADASGARPSDAANPGLVVSASRLDDTASQSGTAGGYIGYGSGVQVSHSNVTQLRHTAVTEPKDLEGTDGSSYFGNKSSYAVTAPRYAGGYIGHMDVGSAASVGDGLSLLGTSLRLTDVLGVVRAVVSTIEHSDVTGGTGGFAVRASSGATGSEIGDAGGFAGLVSGGHIQDSNSYNFSYVIGQISAGGYAGQIEPGDVARVLGELNTGKDNESALAKLLHGLVSTNGALASLVQDFVPTVRNSETTSIPCGGAVRAQAASTESVQRGMAGGYVGHNLGGHIWGTSNAPWTSAASWESEKDGSNHYTGTQRDAMAERIRSVYGAEMAGGFTGYMEPGDTAKTGSVSLLFGLVKANNILGALQVAYPTEENTQVTGPVRGISLETWNSWSQHVASKGYYGGDFYGKTFTTEDELAAFLADYVYGTNVVAGRAAYENKANTMHGGVAGGYVGLMRGGTVTNGRAFGTKTVRAMRAAGGFAGRMETGGAVELGGVKVLGLNLNLGQLLNVAQVLVPVVKSSSVQGFRTGMAVKATGTDFKHETGFAGGYVGYASGAQLWGDATFSDADKDANRWSIGATHSGYTATGDNVTNLRKVSGANCVGGYAGLMTAAGVADVNTNTSSGLLQKILDTLIDTPNDLAQVLQATLSTVRGASVSAVTAGDGATDAQRNAAAWGFTVDGSYKEGNATKYARAAGGFAGSMKAVVAGTKDRDEGATDAVTNTLQVIGLRGVEGGQYAGGFFGQADIESVASVAGGDGDANGDQSTSLLLKLLKAGNISALDAFRTYVYHANVAGVADGFQVRAHDASKQGMLDSTRFTGVAGGFGGALINGSVKNATVANLSSVEGVNYTGGFIGHLGKGGTVDADKVGVLSNLSLLGATAGVLDIWGSHVENSSVTGIADGYTVTSTHRGADYGRGTEAAGGFAGYADLARVKDCTVTNLKKVASGEVAGGFVGETKRAYLVDAQVSSVLVDGLLVIVNALLKLLYANQLQNLGVIDIGKWFPGVSKVFDLKVLAEGETLYVNLFGLKVGVALSRADTENKQQTDVAIITIGDSTIKLPCTEKGGVDTKGDRANIDAQLIKGNRTRVENSSVTGIAVGYDVFGGGASQAENGDGLDGLTTGYAGGFAGLNDEGVLANDHMVLADVIRGTSGLVDPFANTKLKSVWDFNSMSDIVGEKDGNYNSYKIYRSRNESLADAFTSNSKNGAASATFAKRDGNADGTGMDAFTVSLLKPVDASGKASVNTYDGTVPTSEASGDADTAWLGIKDAVRQNADGSQRQELKAYESAAKAVLMRDTPVSDNAGGITPEPGEGQDPCDTYVKLTLQKVWDDQGNKAGLRPASIKLTVVASYKDAAGNVVTPAITLKDGSTWTNPHEVELTGKDASNWSDTWRTVIEGLPVAVKDADGATHYLNYAVQGEAVNDGAAAQPGVRFGKVEGGNTAYVPPEQAGYSSAVGSEANTLTITVTNTHRDALPDTGGRGIWLFLMIGAALGCAGAYEAWRRRRAGQLAVAGAPTAGATVTALQPRPVGGHFRDGGAR